MSSIYQYFSVHDARIPVLFWTVVILMGQRHSSSLPAYWNLKAMPIVSLSYLVEIGSLNCRKIISKLLYKIVRFNKQLNLNVYATNENQVTWMRMSHSQPPV